MKLTINEQIIEFDTKKNIQEILDSLKIETKTIAIVLNGKLIAKSVYNDTFPNDGDKIDFLEFVGGG